MIKVGISGKIASGKSEVEKIIKNEGFLVFDLDIISHILLEKDDYIKSCVQKEFKTLNRKEIGEIVFKNSSKRKKLENIIYPKLESAIFELFEKYKNEKAIFVSGALLFKSGFYKMFDKTIFVNAKDDIRLERLMKRNNLDKNEAKKRLNLQDEPIFPDFLINNNEDLNKLNKSVLEVLAKINQ